jgi:branched-chain amino acid transport system permease protein
MIIIGGLGSVMGSMMGAMLMTMLPEVVQWFADALAGS